MRRTEQVAASGWLGRLGREAQVGCAGLLLLFRGSISASINKRDTFIFRPLTSTLQWKMGTLQPALRSDT